MISPRVFPGKGARGLLVCLMWLALTGCGGGTDIGNPEIRGSVEDENGFPAMGARVVLGRTDDRGGLDTTHVKDLGAIQICFSERGFDTAYTDNKGEFVFDDMVPGRYTLLASKGTLLGLEKFEHSSYDLSDISLRIARVASISVATRGNQESFVAARIAGTTIATPCSVGTFTFDTVPAGDLDIIFYRPDSTTMLLQSFTTSPGCAGSILADSSRDPAAWQSTECGPRDWYGTPYVLSSLPADGALGDAARVNYGKQYDVQIRFSHPVDAYTVRRGLTAISTSGNLGLDSVWFEGANVAYLTFCVSGSTGACSRPDTLYRPGVTYSVIVDTTAQSAAGVGFAYPETLSFTPEPLAGGAGQ